MCHSLRGCRVVGVSLSRAGLSLKAVALVSTILVISGLSVSILGESSLAKLGRRGTTFAPNMGPAGSTNHFVVIVMENKNYGDIIGNWSSAPYINHLASDYGIASNYFQVSLNKSLPNY